MLEVYKEEFEQEIKPRLVQNLKEVSNLREGGELGRIDLLEMYYPIYKTAESAYKVPWYVLWVIHDAESSVSTDPDAFTKGRNYFGAMQRWVTNDWWHNHESVARATQGHEYLGELDQNHPSDWEEILWAAWFINYWTSYNQAQDPSLSWEEALRVTIKEDYSASWAGEQRLQRIDYLENILSR